MDGWPMVCYKHTNADILGRPSPEHPLKPLQYPDWCMARCKMVQQVIQCEITRLGHASTPYVLA
jgi:hypothetical protein